MKKIEPYYIKIADILLQHGADINKKSNEVAPLHFAAQVPQNEKPILLKYFLEKGANPNIRDFKEIHRYLQPILPATEKQ